ncbi:PepSY domain-containing protein [Halopseudomonas salina]|uniref:PepSY domain-containing protein n=1 Tax=Halopseudomonas salina TaxID=1323744 RepID=A0ABQ1P5A4_9GAMM|nr:PepSY domain-containing protein [Halopseudomonas salina]GGC90868.1 hypothetical protein GCM10007418_08180 [Halopseudomonas salina]
MKTKPLFVSLVLVFLSTSVLADDDCDDPVASWQPRENLRQKLEAEGWTVYRIKVDDGCYEVKGLAPEGYRAEASFAPASLLLMELEREDDDDDGRHGTKRGKNTKGSAAAPVRRSDSVEGRPSVTIE